MTPNVPTRRAAFDNLKLFVIFLVVLHHSILAYCRLGYFDRAHYLRSSAPIIDPTRWIGFDLIADFNDVYFMSLMFFLSGLFVLPSLARHGPRRYVANRALRLALPLVVAVVLIMPLALYPSFLESGAAAVFPSYWLGIFASSNWPPGPCWFILVLFAFDALAALAAWRFPILVTAATTMPSRLLQHPLRGLALFAAIAIAAYLPLLHWFGPNRWFTWGPISFQECRIGLYAVFFIAGMALGSAGPHHPIFLPDSLLARRWPIAAILAALTFTALVTLQILALRHVVADHTWRQLRGLAFVLDCLFASLALLGLFLRKLDRRTLWLDRLIPCAFGIYILHYAPMTWLQFALLGADVPAIAKGATVLVLTWLSTWLAIAGLRQNRGARRILS